MLVSLFTAAALAQAAAALPPPVLPPKECRDDNHADRCAPADRARVIALLGMTAADAEARAGIEAYRVFFVDGYGRDRPAIAFERRPGQSPKAVVYAQGRRIEAPASISAWRQVKAGAEFADRALVELPKTAGSELRMCLHAWVTRVEIVNAPTRDAPSAPVRARTENACDSGLTTQFAFELSTLALHQFPACEALRADSYRNDVERLASCTTLHGDTVAAAELSNQIGGRLNLRQELEPAMAWRSWMGINATPELNWAGQVTRDDERRENRVGKFLAAQNAAGRLNLYPVRIEGLDTRRVKVAGRIYRPSSSVSETQEGAPYEQTWIWGDAAQEWMLESWTVGAFAAKD